MENATNSCGYFFPARFTGTAEAALLAAHLALSASESLLLPAGVIPPLRLAFTGAAGTVESAFLAAHLALSASESLLRPSGVMPPFRFAFLGRPRGADAAAGAGAPVSRPGPSISRKAAKARSIPIRCCSSFLITSFRLLAIFVPVDLMESTNTNHNASIHLLLLSR